MLPDDFGKMEDHTYYLTQETVRDHESIRRSENMKQIKVAKIGTDNGRNKEKHHVTFPTWNEGQIFSK